MATRNPELAGVGGWLLFFVIVLAVLSPLRAGVELALLLRNEADMAAFFGANWPAIRTFEFGLSGFAVLAFWFFAWRLVKVHVWQTVRLVIAGIWIVGPGTILAELAGISMLTDAPMDEMAGAIGAGIVQPIIFCVIWTAYLLKSERVANTYGRPGHFRDVDGVFG